MKLYILHDFDGRPYYKALEGEFDVIYLNTRPFRFFIRDLIKYKKLRKDTLMSVFFILKMPFLKDENIILAMAPFNFRVVLYGMLSLRNRVHYHTSWPFWDGCVPFEYPLLMKRVLKVFWRKLLTSFDSKIAVTKGASKSLSEFLNCSSVTQIPHSVDVDIIDKSDLELRYARGDIRVGFLGRLDESKGIQLFLDIYNRLSDSKYLNFYCAGRGEYSSKVRSLSNSNSNFNYCGFISKRADVKSFLSDMDFLLVPSIRSDSWEELFGLVVIEAMSQGVIVFATDHIGPVSIINHEVDGFTIQQDVFIDTCLKYLQCNKVNFKSMSLEAMKTSEKYKIDIIADEWKSKI